MATAHPTEILSTARAPSTPLPSLTARFPWQALRDEAATRAARGVSPWARVDRGSGVQNGLARLMAERLIPDLRRRHGLTDDAAVASWSWADGEIDSLVALAARPDPERAVAFVETAQRAGAPLDALLLGLLPAADRRCAASLDGLEQAFAMTALRLAARVIARPLGPTGRPARGLAVIAAPTGATPGLGGVLHEVYLARDGWAVWNLEGVSAEELRAALGEAGPGLLVLPSPTASTLAQSRAAWAVARRLSPAARLVLLRDGDEDEAAVAALRPTALSDHPFETVRIAAATEA